MYAFDLRLEFLLALGGDLVEHRHGALPRAHYVCVIRTPLHSRAYLEFAGREHQRLHVVLLEQTTHVGDGGRYPDAACAYALCDMLALAPGT